MNVGTKYGYKTRGNHYIRNKAITILEVYATIYIY